MIGQLFTAIVHRREPQRTESYPWRANQRPIEPIPYSPVPDPIRQSDFNDYGKPRSHSQSRMQIAIPGYSRVGYFAVMRDSFVPPMLAPRPQIATPAGMQRPYRERINIARTPAAAYGSLFELQRPAGM